MKNKLIIFLFALLTVLYAIIVMLAPTDPAVLSKYNINQGQARLLVLTVVIPLAVIWMSALYGAIRFKEYSKVIEKTKEGKAFRQVSKGLTVLAFSLPAGAVVGAILSSVTVNHPNLLSSTTVIRNYVNLVLPAVGLLIINEGASKLIASLKHNKVATWPPYSLTGIIVLSSCYTWLITTRTFGSNGDTGYFLPNWLTIATIAIPYLYVWCRGILGAYKFFVYKRNISGVVYKKSLDYLAKGVGVIVLLSVVSQFLITLSARLNRLNLTPILLIIYLLVALNALGYGLVARGARKLKLIEEV